MQHIVTRWKGMADRSLPYFLRSSHANHVLSSSRSHQESDTGFIADRHALSSLCELIYCSAY